MKRLTKAAVATGGAAVLLLGGAGTYAFWTADGTAAGTVLTSGTFDLADGDCTEWTYSESDGGSGSVTTIVPGDSVATTCEFEVTATGDHIGIGDVTVSEPTWVEDNPLTAQLGPATVESTTLNGVPFDEPVATETGDVIAVTVAVTFEGDPANNESQNLSATLNDITVTINQAHVASA